MERGSSGSSAGGSTSSFIAGFANNNNNDNSNTALSSSAMMMIDTNPQILEQHNNNNNSDSSNNNNKMFLPLSWSSATPNNAPRVSAFVPQLNNNNDLLNNSTCRAKIMAHPLFPRLLAAYVNCQKVRKSTVIHQLKLTVTIMLFGLVGFSL